VRGLLEREGYRVTEAVDGAEALQRVGTGQEFTLILTDLEMPNVDGAALLSKLRSTKATALAPVIVLTGKGDRDIEIALMDRGADDYIQKPIDPMRLVARVRAALRRAGI
jgi:DNA-binding response OmpR family regulator